MGLAVEGVVVGVGVQGKWGWAVVVGVVGMGGMLRGAMHWGAGHARGMRVCPGMQQADNVHVVRSGAAAVVSDTELHQRS